MLDTRVVKKAQNPPMPSQELSYVNYIQGKILKGTYLYVMPFVYQNEQGEVIGGEPSVFKTLAEINGFKPYFYMENTWFEFDANGNIVGTLGAVYNKNAHLAFGGHFFENDAWQFVDFVDAYTFDVVYQTAKPTKLPPYFNMAKPFSPLVWYAVLGTLALIMIVAPIFNKFSGNRGDDLLVHSLDMLAHQFSQTTYWGNTVSANVFLMSWTWYAFFIHSMFDCNLRAYLMIADRTPQVDSIRDIWDQVCGIILALVPLFIEHIYRDGICISLLDLMRAAIMKLFLMKAGNTINW